MAAHRLPLSMRGLHFPLGKRSVDHTLHLIQRVSLHASAVLAFAKFL